MKTVDLIVIMLSLISRCLFVDRNWFSRASCKSTLTGGGANRNCRSAETPRLPVSPAPALPFGYKYSRVLARTRFTPTPAIRSFEQNILKIVEAAQASRIVQ